MNRLSPSGDVNKLRWEKVGKTYLPGDTAEAYVSDADGGRYTVKRLKHDKNWEAKFLGRQVRLEMRYLGDKSLAVDWCEERHYDHLKPEPPAEGANP
jgi:hypothetical protein